MGELVAQIIVDNNSYATDKLFDYLIPNHLVEDLHVGMRVIVPFGKGNKKLEGYVLNIKALEDFTIKLKPIAEVIDFNCILDKNQIRQIFWLKSKYLCKYIEAIHCIIPAGIVHKEKKTLKLIDKDWNKKIPTNFKMQRLVMKLIEESGGEIGLDNLNNHIPSKDSYKALKALNEGGYIQIENHYISRVKVKTEEYAKLKLTLQEGQRIIEENKRAIKQNLVLELLLKHKEMSFQDIYSTINVSRGQIKALEKKGYLVILEREFERSPFMQKEIHSFPKLEATEQQKKIIREISNSLKDNRVGTYLIHGITGSGKTEIYLQLMEAANQLGKQGIILVPEISLTPQILERFRGRFKDGIAVFHSNLSEGERYDQWRKIAEGKVNMVIGARSAIFAPFKNLGLIIIDEEHEHTYKSEQNPKYHAVEVAEFRSLQENAVLVLGSATPSLESYYKAQKGVFPLATLDKRVKGAKLPTVEVIDMKDELDNGNNSILSRRLLQLIKSNLLQKRQVILLLNRRGYSNYVSCKSCGDVIKCENCDISMTFHMDNKSLKCHYCGLNTNAPTSCPSCNSNLVKYFGAGTQKLEKLIQHYFPPARVGRLDVDVTGIKGAHEKILGDFEKGNTDILIGTQMISKGLDFPNVTLVGIISIDSTLNLPDFRASEKTFQLITQVAGRAGRGDMEGRVILQTYDPDHFSIVAAADQNYTSFYQEEIKLRKEFAYPPYNSLIALNFSGGNQKEVRDYSERIAALLQYILKSKGVSQLQNIILGPNEAILARINKKFRFQIILKDYGIDFNLLKGVVKRLFIDNRDKYLMKGISVSIDINPYNLM